MQLPPRSARQGPVPMPPVERTTSTVWPGWAPYTAMFTGWPGTSGSIVSVSVEAGGGRTSVGNVAGSAPSGA
jgi:hypothetical protein